MTSASFRRAVSKALNQARVTVATLKYGSHYPEVDAVTKRSVQLEITKDNRDEIYRELLEEVDHAIGQSQS